MGFMCSSVPYPTLPFPTLPFPTLPFPNLPYLTLPFPNLPYLSCKEQRMISEIYILFFKASLTIRHTATVSQKKKWDFQKNSMGLPNFKGRKSGLPGFES